MATVTPKQGVVNRALAEVAGGLRITESSTFHEKRLLAEKLTRRLNGLARVWHDGDNWGYTITAPTDGHMSDEATYGEDLVECIAEEVLRLGIELAAASNKFRRSNSHAAICNVKPVSAEVQARVLGSFWSWVDDAYEFDRYTITGLGEEGGLPCKPR